MGALLVAVAPDYAGGAEAADRVAVEHPHALAVDLLDPGYASRNAAGARLVNRSGGSDQWESASTMNRSSNGDAASVSE